MRKATLLKAKILKEVSTIVKTKTFKDWLKNEKISASKNFFLAFNNSFIFRENIKTSKSEKFLALDITSTKDFDTKKVYIVKGVNFNSHFKIFELSTDYVTTSLNDAIKKELEEIGEVIYTLVGEIEDINEVTEYLDNSNFKSLTLSPTLTKDFTISGNEIKIKDYADRELIWSNIHKYCDDNTIGIPQNFPGMIDRAITALQKKAYSNLILPKNFDAGKKYLLDKISEVIETHLKSYKLNISKIDSDNNAMVEILRISYNFVSDVNKLLTLVINLCDLKPLILWLTISKHTNLDDKFKDLPFGFSKPKASLADYESVIKNARNKSFHQLFPFNKSLRFKLAALEQVSVTIFSSYNVKNGNVMEYKDQKLNELLRSFTRVTEEIVSKNFWIKNELVMQAVQGLIIETSEAIKSTKQKSE